MPESPSTLIHWHPAANVGGRAVCDASSGGVAEQPGLVTCFACRNNTLFKQAQQGVGTPTPLPQREMPRLLKDIVAEDHTLTEMESRAWQAALPAARNSRGMYVIEESIHHGDYRSTRRVEVYGINAVTVDCIIQSSAYCYGSWLHPENPDHKQARNTKLHQLVEDLRHGRTNRTVGWSTFRLITDHS